MRDHELELIAALAEGRLEDEAEARALIADSEQHRAEYEAQKAALEALSAMGPARMTENERAVLHREVWSALRAEPRPRRRTAPWYYRWSYAAAGLLVVVGSVAILSRGGGDQAAETLEEATATRSASTEAPAYADTEDAAAAVAESPTDDGSGAEADLLRSFLADQATAVRKGLFPGEAATAGADEGTLAAEQAACVERSGLEDYVAIGEVALAGEETGLQAGDSYLVAVPAGEALTPETPVAFVSLDTCELAHTDP